MTDAAIRQAAALDLAADEAARAWVLTDEAEFFFPAHAKQLLRRVDVMRGEWRMAPVIYKGGEVVPDMARSFMCMPADARELQLGTIA